MYRNKDRKGGFRKKMNYTDKTTYGYEGKPEKEEVVNDRISIKSMKDLPKSTYALHADPYSAALPTSEPYPILNKFNRVVGGTYDGDDNIDGGNVQQYSNSTKSNLLKAFDEMRLKINANYRYLPINEKILDYNVISETITKIEVETAKFLSKFEPQDQNFDATYDETNTKWVKTGTTQTVTLSDYGINITGTPDDEDRIVINVKYAGKQLIEEMRKSIAESVSILQSTTFTQMAINNFAIVTDLPMGSAQTHNIAAAGETPIYAYTNTTDVLYAMSIYYQLVLQNALSVMNWHNSFRLKQGTMIRNAWNREVPVLNSFFGLMNKKAFLSMLESINLSFEGEYIDKDFMMQMNMLTLMPSRRSNSISDPVLELQCGFNHPSLFKVYYAPNGVMTAGATPIFDDSLMYLMIDVNGVRKAVSFWEACDALRDMLSMEETQYWARSNYVPGRVTHTDNGRYNQIKEYFDVIIASFTRFKPSWSDFREAFDVMTRTGTISWTKGFRPAVNPDTDAQLFWNVLVDHIYQFVMSGANELEYDENTKRWRTFSLWNMYSGIPSYDLKSGGAFLTLSFKKIGTGIKTVEQYEYLPLLFVPYKDDNDTVKCIALSRDGIEAEISQYYTNIQDNVVLNRLAPLESQSNLDIRVPSVEAQDELTIGHYSNLYKTLTQIFGSCRIQTEEEGEFDYSIDPDVLSVYQIEITDITNMAITYARSNAPFRGTTSSAGVLGFAKIK